MYGLMYGWKKTMVTSRSALRALRLSDEIYPFEIRDTGGRGLIYVYISCSFGCKVYLHIYPVTMLK